MDCMLRENVCAEILQDRLLQNFGSVARFFAIKWPNVENETVLRHWGTAWCLSRRPCFVYDVGIMGLCECQWTHQRCDDSTWQKSIHLRNTVEHQRRFIISMTSKNTKIVVLTMTLYDLSRSVAHASCFTCWVRWEYFVSTWNLSCPIHARTFSLKHIITFVHMRLIFENI